MYAYCLNNPENNIDPTGNACVCLTNRVGPRHVCNDSKRQYIINTTSVSQNYGYFIAGAEGTTKILAAGAAYLYATEPRPNNIGKGLHAKNVKSNLKRVDNILDTADGVFGTLGTIGDGLGIVEGAYINYCNGASSEKIIWDACVDTYYDGINGAIASTAGTVCGKLTTTIVTKISTSVGGSVAGPIGIAVGFVIGLVIGEILSRTTNSRKEEAKSWIN